MICEWAHLVLLRLSADANAREQRHQVVDLDALERTGTYPAAESQSSGECTTGVSRDAN